MSDDSSNNTDDSGSVVFIEVDTFVPIEDELLQYYNDLIDDTNTHPSRNLNNSTYPDSQEHDDDIYGIDESHGDINFEEISENNDNEGDSPVFHFPDDTDYPIIDDEGTIVLSSGDVSFNSRHSNDGGLIIFSLVNSQASELSQTTRRSPSDSQYADDELIAEDPTDDQILNHDGEHSQNEVLGFGDVVESPERLEDSEMDEDMEVEEEERRGEDYEEDRDNDEHMEENEEEDANNPLLLGEVELRPGNRQFEVVDHGINTPAIYADYLRVFSGELITVNNQFHCPYCKVVSVDRKNLYNHISKMHDPQNSTPCFQCQCPLVRSHRSRYKHDNFCRKSLWIDHVTGKSCHTRV